MAAVVFAFQGKSSAPTPWQNHELAELYRAVDILGRAGLAIETDNGLSDEGDPWFAFCRPDTGDVLVHFARIDGRYIAASIAVDDTFQGANFREIVDQIVGRHPLVVPAPTNGTRLFLHPAVILTAFIAAALLFSHQAEAADSLTATAPVGSGHDTADASAGGVSAVLKHFFAEVFNPQAQHPLTAAKAEFVSESAPSAFLASLVAIAIAAVEPNLSGNVADSALADLSHTAPDAQEAPTHVAYADQVDVSPLTATPEHVSQTSAVTTGDTQSPVQRVMTDRADDVGAQQVVVAAPDHALPAHSESGAVQDRPTTVPVPGAEITPDHAVVKATPVQTASVGATTQSASTSVVSGPYIFDGYVLSAEAVKVFVSASTSVSVSATTISTAQAAAGDTATIISASATVGSTDGSANLPGWLHISAATSGAAQTGTVASTAVVAPAQGSVTQAALTSYDPAVSLTTVINFIFSNQHNLNVDFKPSDALAFVLNAYVQMNHQAATVVIYDSTNMEFPIFGFTQGVLFVDDHLLTGKQSVNLATSDTATVQLANGGTATLVGVVTADHLLV